MKRIFNLLFLIAFIPCSYATTFTVTASGTAFSPTNLTIHQGDIVTWTFSGTHNVVSGMNCTSDGKFSSGTKNAGDTYSFTFTTVGEYPYFCAIHCSMGMTGTIIVSSASGIEPAKIADVILKAYPNPFTTQVMVEYQIPRNGNVNLVVTDINGKSILDMTQLKSSGLNRENLPSDRLVPGVYFLKLNLDGIPVKDILLVKE